MKPSTIDFLPTVPPLNRKTMEQARRRLDTLTKPSGSLGRLEEIAVWLAGVTGKARQRLPTKTVILMAGDHGVVQEGVSAYPQSATAQMVANFLRGGAAINSLARRAGAHVVVVDIGVAGDLAPHPDLKQKKIARGTGNIAKGPAMTREQAMAAIQAGVDVVEEQLRQGVDLLATGDMGIGNTTPSSAITAVLTGRAPRQVTGRGTGIDDAALMRKVAVIERALAVNQPDPDDPLDVLAKLGGYEIAGLVGVILRGAAERIPIIMDGFISGAAALVAARLCPRALEYLLAAHCSVEPGHRAILQTLELEPLLSIGLRLGEGTGAVLAMHLVDDALAVMDEMATFEEAGVANRTVRA